MGYKESIRIKLFVKRNGGDELIDDDLYLGEFALWNVEKSAPPKIYRCECGGKLKTNPEKKAIPQYVCEKCGKATNSKRAFYKIGDKEVPVRVDTESSHGKNVYAYMTSNQVLEKIQTFPKGAYKFTALDERGKKNLPIIAESPRFGKTLTFEICHRDGTETKTLIVYPMYGTIMAVEIVKADRLKEVPNEIKALEQEISEEKAKKFFSQFQETPQEVFESRSIPKVKAKAKPKKAKPKAESELESLLEVTVKKPRKKKAK